MEIEDGNYSFYDFMVVAFWFIIVCHYRQNVAISGLSSRDEGNPYIVYGISVNKLIYREQRDDKPDIAQNVMSEVLWVFI